MGMVRYITKGKIGIEKSILNSSRLSMTLFGELLRLLISQAYINKVKIWRFLFFFILCTSY